MRAFIATAFWAAVGLAYAAAYGPEALEPGKCRKVEERGRERIRCEDTSKLLIQRLRGLVPGVDP